MSKKKKPKKKKSAAALNKEALLKYGMINSKFLKKLRDAFKAPSPGLWTVGFPPSSDAEQRKIQIKDDLADCFRSMFQVSQSDPPGQPFPGAPTSATELLADVIQKSGWAEDDDGKVPVPPPWDDEHEDEFRLYEIACAMNILLLAYANFGDPGGRPTWPPEKPAKAP